MNIALIGPSGAGKGTHVSTLVSHFNLIHLSTGDLFRDNLRNDTPLGQIAKAYIAKGELVPDDIVDAMIEEWLKQTPEHAGILFDGFPRTVTQSAFIDKNFAQSGRKLAALVYLHASDREVLKRISGRRICGECHTPFHETSSPFNICPLGKCSGEHLFRRPDDSPEITRARLKHFHRATVPLIQCYFDSHRLVIINGEQDEDAVERDLIDCCRALESGKPEFATETDLQRLRQTLIPEPSSLSRKPQRSTLDLVLLGAPGSGKGTQADTLSDRFKLQHVATGDLFRRHLKNETTLGLMAKEFMNRGELVPDDITDAMVHDWLAQEDTNHGFILDGFPRSLHQAEALTEMLTEHGRKLSGVIYIRVSDDEIIARLGGRLICRDCQTPYHLKFNPPAIPGICNSCGGELYHRDDDRPETIRARLKTFHAQTEPLIEFYQRSGLLRELNGEQDISQVVKDSAAAVEALRARSAAPHETAV